MGGGTGDGGGGGGGEGGGKLQVTVPENVMGTPLFVTEEMSVLSFPLDGRLKAFSFPDESTSPAQLTQPGAVLKVGIAGQGENGGGAEATLGTLARGEKNGSQSWYPLSRGIHWDLPVPQAALVEQGNLCGGVVIVGWKGTRTIARHIRHRVI